MTRLRPALTLALLLACAPAALAQEGTPLSLEQARAVAAEHNPIYRRAENDAVSARASELATRSQFLPTLSGSFSSGGNSSRRRTGEDNFGQPIEGEVLKYTGSSSSQSLSLGWQLFDGGARWRQARAAGAAREAATAGIEVAEVTVLAEVTRRYYEAQRAVATIALEESLLQAAEVRQTATERLLRVASASPVDLLGAELEVARHREVVEAARGAARIAMLALAEQMGVDAEAEQWTLVTEPPAIFDPTTLDAEALVTRAHEASPQLRQIGLMAQQAEHQRRAASAERWPTVSVNTSFGRSIGAQGYGALFEPNPFDQNFSFGLGISIPIFNQYQTSQRITQARMAADNADESARQTRLQLEREVRTALIDLERAYRTVELNNASTELARRRLELANERFRLGAIPFTEMQQIVADAAAAEREALNARYEFARALATLEESAGPVTPAP